MRNYNKHKENKKAAFQLSMGFIITIVFAVVLLSLALVWLRGAIGGIEDLTATLIQQAGVKIDETFQESDVNFAIWPPDGPVFEVSGGTRIAVVAGIRNVASDSAQHNFGIDMTPVTDPSGQAGGWIVEVPPPKSIAFGSNTRFPIIIEIPNGAPQDTYIFRITACSDDDNNNNPTPPTSTDCPSGVQYIWGGAARDFVLSVTA